MYQLEAVTKSYERKNKSIVALQETNLTIAGDEFVAVVGPSGSGKTTLLSVLGGMLAPSTGTVCLDGESLYQMNIEGRTAIRASKIGFVFQTFNLIPWLTARENVQIPLLLNRKSPAEQCERALEMLERVGLADRTDHRPSELSQGQQQRVALARTLANDPKIILADEPTGNLDSETREKVMQYLSDFHQEGRMIVMVTHDEVAASYASRTIRMINGQVESPVLVEAA